MELCLVYAPRQAELFHLNPLAWFVFRACEGTTQERIAMEYCAAMAPLLPLGEAAREVHAALEGLLAMGIVERDACKPRRTKSQKRRVRDAKES